MHIICVLPMLAPIGDMHTHTHTNIGDVMHVCHSHTHLHTHSRLCHKRQEASRKQLDSIFGKTRCATEAQGWGHRGLRVVCVCVCVYVCVCVCVCACLHVCMCWQTQCITQNASLESRELSEYVLACMCVQCIYCLRAGVLVYECARLHMRLCVCTCT